MFASIKRLIGAGSDGGREGEVLAAWAQSQGYVLKRVRDKDAGGYVVDVPDRSWRLEWGSSQRPYIHGKELRFRCETQLAPDVQLVMLSRVLAHALETEVFSRFTNAMQTQVDNSLPEEMRWLPMHPRVALSEPPVLSKRFVILCNAQEVADQWLDEELLDAFEGAASAWWTDTLNMVLTINRGRLTVRMSGLDLEEAQLRALSALFIQAAGRLREVAASAA